jgi:hypothetical protein
MHAIRKLTRRATGGVIDLRTDRDIIADYTKRLERAHGRPGSRRVRAHALFDR